MQKQFCFMVVLLALSGAALAQTPTPPPVKIGLWQTTNTITVSGIQMPPDVAARLQAMGRPLPTAQPRTVVTQSCLTTEKWKNIFTDMQRDHDCHFTNLHQTSDSMSADMACTSGDSRMGAHSIGHIDVSFSGTEKMHGKAHIETIVQSQAQPILMDMSFDSAYQGSDCQGISPDSAKVIR